MANVKNFGLIGVGSDLQFGKAGTRLINTAGTFNFKAANGSTDAALTAAGITSSSGNITLTTGNLIASAGDLDVTLGSLNLSSTDGVVSFSDAGTLGRAGAGVFSFSGTGAVVVPSGTAAEQPAAGSYEAGFRYNTDSSLMEYSNGIVWTPVGNTAPLQTEIDAIEASLGPAINTDGTFNAAGFTTNAAVTAATSFTNAINQLSAYAVAHDTLDEIFPGTDGQIIYNDGGTWALAVPGVTSGVQPYDEDLTQIAAFTSVGFAVRTGTDAWSQRDITGTAARIVVTNGDGVLASPTIDLATVTNPGAGGSFVKVTTDAYGRVTDSSAVVAADITALVGAIYVDVAGDTMTGDLVMSGGATVTGLPDPVNDSDAANKAYVDATAAGLTWKTAVLAATTTNITLSAPQTIDGVAVVAGNRVLVKNQTLPQDNGIYIVAAGAWTRSTDADSPSELDSAAVFVQQGSSQADTGWTQTATIVTVGTTPQVWVQFSGANAYIGGTGIDISGNTISVNLGAGIGEFNTDNVGIDLFDTATGAIILTTDGTTRSISNAGQLQLLLDPAGALAQGSAGLRIDAASVTNAMLVNSFITIDADTGTSDNAALGSTFLFAGDTAQGVSTEVATGSVTISVQDATDTLKGVASFAAASFTVTAGAVTLNTVDVAHGGTGAATLLDTAVLIGNGANPIEATTALTFVIDTLTVAENLSIQGDDGVTNSAVLTVIGTDGDLVLMPNGTGSVIIGPVGAGLIQSDSGTALTVRGNNGLTLETGTVGQDIIMLMPSGTGTKVTVSGPNSTDYATGLTANDLVNKQYVDDAIATGASAGSIKAVTATVSLVGTGSVNVGSPLPAGATVLSVKVVVTAADTGTGTLQVGVAGDGSLMSTSENDTQTTGMYLAETYVVEGGSVQVQATVGGTPAGAGSATVIVEYKVAG